MKFKMNHVCLIRFSCLLHLESIFKSPVRGFWRKESHLSLISGDTCSISYGLIQVSLASAPNIILTSISTKSNIALAKSRHAYLSSYIASIYLLWSREWNDNVQV